MAVMQKLEWRVQVVGTGLLADTAPVDLGTIHADHNEDGSITVSGADFTDRLTLAMAAFTAVMNAQN